MPNAPELALAKGWPAPRSGPYVKICGITSATLATAAAAAGADMIGLVHFPPSPRHLEISAAREVADVGRAAGMLVVALTVDVSEETLDALVEGARPDAIQCHGWEPPRRIKTIAARYGLPVAKAFGVAEAGDLEPVVRYDALPVLDAKPPKGADRPGGHGAAFDWNLLAAMGPGRPYMLSGGLSADNVGEAVRTATPYAVDVSSKVETDGLKDPEKMAAFVAAVKGN